ncbi:MAG: holin [Firmicutes bacterium]|nr:holin [Bacillota bacterium]
MKQFWRDKEFWLDTLERAFKTATQTAIAAIGTAEVIHHVDWKFVISTVALATVLSVLSSISSMSITGRNRASLLAKRLSDN